MISAVMISCRGRNYIREQTLKCLFSTDWDWSVNVVLDHEVIDHNVIDSLPNTTRQVLASLCALKQAVTKPDPFIVFMEDDLHFNVNIKYNLINWYPIKEKKLNFGSLYTPKNNKCIIEKGKYWYIADCLRFYGSQFYIMSREAALWAIDKWDTIQGLQDTKLTRLSIGKPIYYYDPSLVEHRSVPSSWGGVCHTSEDFDQFWKHPT